MMEQTSFTRKERVILESALKLMLADGYEGASARCISERLMLERSLVTDLFPSDHVLRLSAMRYAALVWVRQVRDEMASLPTPRDQLKRLVRLFAAGPESHSHSLALYVDAWKALKEAEPEERALIADALAEIYQIYVDLFRDIVVGMTNGRALSGADVTMIGWILVVISDGFFVQSLIQRTPLNFDQIGEVLYKMVESTVLKQAAELPSRE